MTTEVHPSSSDRHLLLRHQQRITYTLQVAQQQWDQCYFDTHGTKQAISSWLWSKNRAELHVHDNRTGTKMRCTDTDQKVLKGTGTVTYPTAWWAFDSWRFDSCGCSTYPCATVSNCLATNQTVNCINLPGNRTRCQYILCSCMSVAMIQCQGTCAQFRFDKNDTNESYQGQIWQAAVYQVPICHNSLWTQWR